MEIKEMLSQYRDTVISIYAEGIATGNATFEKEPPSWEDWDATHIKNSRLVAVENEEVLGWAALSPVSGRCVYGGVGEVSIYIKASARGRGVGKKLLKALIDESERNGFWTLQAGIFPENTGSIKIHEACGFRIVGYRERIGLMDGRWRDNLLLEKRSKINGI